MDLIDSKTDQELLKSLLAETAKARNEINCSQADLNKAQSRISFLLVIINKLIERQGDQK
jgi:hypothetical protein